MNLDLSKLNNNLSKQEAEKQPVTAAAGSGSIEAQVIEETALLFDFGGAEGIKRLQKVAAAKQKEQSTYQQIYNEYQANARNAGQSKVDILKGLQTGEDIYNLFLKACECISAMTGEQKFKELAEEYIKAVYGTALHTRQPLLLELQEVNARINKICSAIDSEPDAAAVDRLQTALYKHIQKRDRLQELVDQA